MGSLVITRNIPDPIPNFMPTFVPPTHTVPIDAPLWKKYKGVIPVGYSVLITSGAATASPGMLTPTADQITAADSGSGEGGKAWFRGGLSYTVTSGEETILTNAGYGDNIT